MPGGDRSAAWGALRLDRLHGCMLGTLAASRPVEAEKVRDELQPMFPSAALPP